jgi:hypothetical protein
MSTGSFTDSSVEHAVGLLNRDDPDERERSAPMVERFAEIFDAPARAAESSTRG